MYIASVPMVSIPSVPALVISNAWTSPLLYLSFASSFLSDVSFPEIVEYVILLLFNVSCNVFKPLVIKVVYIINLPVVLGLFILSIKNLFSCVQ